MIKKIIIVLLSMCIVAPVVSSLSLNDDSEDNGWVYGTIYSSVVVEGVTYTIPLKGRITLFFTDVDTDTEQPPIEFTWVGITTTSTDSPVSTAYSYSNYHVFSGPNYNVSWKKGSYNLIVKKYGYELSSEIVEIEAGSGTEVDFTLQRTSSPSSPEYESLYGRVLGVDYEGGGSSPLPLANASVRIRRVTDENIASQPMQITDTDSEFQRQSTAVVTSWLDEHELTDENGDYEFNHLIPGVRYRVIASKYGYYPSTENITLDESTELDFILEKRTDVETSADIKIVPFDESKMSIREVGGEQTVLEIDRAIYSGDVGGEILVEKNLDKQVVSYDEQLSITSLDVESGRLSLVVNGEENLSGKTIVVNVEEGFFDINSDIMVTYDDLEIKMADDIDDILNANDDGSTPEYLIVEGALGVQILVSIPHFSEHSITIYSIAEVLGGITALFYYILASAVAAIIFLGSVFLRRRI